MSTTMPVASRRTFTGLGGGVLAVVLSVSAKGAAAPGLPAAPAPGEALAETRYRTIDVGGLAIFYREAGPATAPVVLPGAGDAGVSGLQWFANLNT
jgi:hypothetical protein